LADFSTSALVHSEVTIHGWRYAGLTHQTQGAMILRFSLGIVVYITCYPNLATALHGTDSLPATIASGRLGLCYGHKPDHRLPANHQRQKPAAHALACNLRQRYPEVGFHMGYWRVLSTHKPLITKQVNQNLISDVLSGDAAVSL